MKEDQLSPMGQGMRDALLERADLTRAIEVTNQLIDTVLDGFNDANTSVATSMVARALMARAMISVGAAWWSDLTKAPLPMTTAVLRSLMIDPPVEFEEHCFNQADEGKPS
jgi:hypothetical protein